MFQPHQIPREVYHSKRTWKEKKNPDGSINNPTIKTIDQQPRDFGEKKTPNNSTDENIPRKSTTLKKPSSSSSSSHSQKKSSDESKKNSSKHHSRNSRDEKKSNDSSSHKTKKSKRQRDSPENPHGTKKIIGDESTETLPKKRRELSPGKSPNKTKKSSSSSSSKVNHDSSSKNTVKDEKKPPDDNRPSTQIGTSKKPRVSRVVDDKKSPRSNTESSKKPSSHKNDANKSSSSKSKNNTTDNSTHKKTDHEKSSGDYLQKLKRRYQREQEEIDKKQDENMKTPLKPKIPVKKKKIVEKIISEPVEDLSSIYEDVVIPDEISKQLDQQINLSRSVQLAQAASVVSETENVVNIPRSRDPRTRSNAHALVDQQINAVYPSQSISAGDYFEDSSVISCEMEPSFVDEAADDNEAGCSTNNLYDEIFIPTSVGDATMLQQIPSRHRVQHEQVPLPHSVQLQQHPEYEEEFIVQSTADPTDQTEFIIPEMIGTFDSDQETQEENSESSGLIERSNVIRVRNLNDLVLDFEKIKICEVPKIIDNLNPVVENECDESSTDLNKILKKFALVMQPLLHNERFCEENIFESNGEIIGRKKRLIAKYFELGMKETDGNLDLFVESCARYFKKSELPYRLDENGILDLAKGALDVSVFF